MKITIDSITKKDIVALRREAESAGDDKMARICRRAIESKSDDVRLAAMLECVAVINAALDQVDEDSTTTVKLEFNGKLVEIECSGDAVAIVVDGVWAGRGRWTGQRVEDCPAVLGDALYEAIDAALLGRVVIVHKHGPTCEPGSHENGRENS